MVGLLVSTSILFLLWYDVGGILAIGDNTDPIDLMYIVWPSASMLTVGWRTTVSAGEKVIRFSRFRPEPVIQREPRSTGTR
jgi:hypothetical protein